MRFDNEVQEWLNALKKIYPNGMTAEDKKELKEGFAKVIVKNFNEPDILPSYKQQAKITILLFAQWVDNYKTKEE